MIVSNPPYFLECPQNGATLGFLFGAVFGVREGHSPLVVPHDYVPLVAQVVDDTLFTLTPREEKVIRMRLGLNGIARTFSQQKVAEHFGTHRNRIREIENKALRKLRHPSRRGLLELFLTNPEELKQIWGQKVSSERQIELVPVIETFKKLEPSLIAHLQQHQDDLVKIQPAVLEHLVAEFLASRGFSDVRLVGRNRQTSADIFAMHFNESLNIPQTYFIEVKRWKERVGIEVIQQVWGAMMLEKQRFGWQAAIIVTLGGYKDLQKWTRQQVEMMGVFLKDRSDLLRWLTGYKQSQSGLWLPSPRTDLRDYATNKTARESIFRFA